MNSGQDANTESFASPATKMLLAYDTAETGRNALALFNQAAGRLKNRAGFNTAFWQFDLMTLPEWARDSEADAADAKVIVVAFGAEAPMTPSLFHWLDDWVEHRHIKDAALGVFSIGAATRANGQTAVAALQSLAQSHGLEFICLDQSMKGEDLAALVQRLDKGDSPAPRQFDNPIRCVPLSEWGLNE